MNSVLMLLCDISLITTSYPILPTPHQKQFQDQRCCIDPDNSMYGIELLSRGCSADHVMPPPHVERIQQL